MTGLPQLDLFLAVAGGLFVSGIAAYGFSKLFSRVSICLAWSNKVNELTRQIAIMEEDQSIAADKLTKADSLLEWKVGALKSAIDEKRSYDCKAEAEIIASSFSDVLGNNESNQNLSSYKLLQSQYSFSAYNYFMYILFGSEPEYLKKLKSEHSFLEKRAKAQIDSNTEKLCAMNELHSSIAAHNYFFYNSSCPENMVNQSGKNLRNTNKLK